MLAMAMTRAQMGPCEEHGHALILTQESQAVSLEHGIKSTTWDVSSSQSTETLNIGVNTKGTCIGVGWGSSRASLDDKGKAMAGATIAEGTIYYSVPLCVRCGRQFRDDSSVAKLTNCFLKVGCGWVSEAVRDSAGTRSWHHLAVSAPLKIAPTTRHPLANTRPLGTAET